MAAEAAAFKEAGNKALAAKDFDTAIENYTKAIELNPLDHVYFSNRSAAYLSKGDGDMALEDAEQCIKLNASFAKGFSRKGAALHALRSYDEAIAAYEAGLAVAPSDAGLQSGLEDARKAKNSARAPSAGGGLGGLFGPQMIAKLAGHPKFGPKLNDPTFKMKLQMMQTNPQMMMQDPEMMEVLSAILGVAGKSGGMGGAGGADGGFGDDDEDDDALPPLEKFGQQQPPRAPAPSASSSSSSSSSASSSKPEPMDIPEDLSPEEREEKENKAKAIAAKERGNALYKEKKFTEAMAAYDEAAALDPKNMTFLNNKAAVFLEMGDIEQALATCQAALEIGRTNRASFEDKAKVYHRIAAAHIKANNIPEALKAYQTAQTEHYDKNIERKMKTLELEFKKWEREQYKNPQLGLEAKERGNAFFRDGNFPKAIEEYEESIKRDPDNAVYRNNLASAYLKMGVFNDAKREVEKALEIDRNYVKAWAKKGDIEMFMKEYHKALESYKCGLQLEPENSLCKEGLQKVVIKINSSQSQEDMAQRQQHAMADPEIQQILADPSIRQVLTDMQENPSYAQKAMSDPTVRAKLEKLIAAGVLQVK